VLIRRLGLEKGFARCAELEDRFRSRVPTFVFDCLIYGSQRTTEARKLAAAIIPSKAFGKHVQYLLKLHFQALELRSQDRCRDFRQEMSVIGLGTRFAAVASIPSDATDVTAYDQDQIWDGDTWWCPIEWHGYRGYVGRSHLASGN
jgi:hypothetical protein